MAVGRTEREWALLVGEYNICKKKLDSKREALNILVKEVEKYKKEKNIYINKIREQQEELDKIKSERTKAKVSPQSSPPQPVEERDGGRHELLEINRSYIDKKCQNLTQLLCQSREETKAIKNDFNNLKQLYQEAQEDIQLLRENLLKQQQKDKSSDAPEVVSMRQDLIAQLEESQEKIENYERELQASQDEKSEIAAERDHFRDKTERLNTQLNYILGADERRIVDIDSLTMENSYQKEQIKQLQEERSVAQAAMARYRTALEKRKSKLLRFGHPQSSGLASKLPSLVESHFPGLGTGVSQSTVADMQYVASCLSETLTDKNMALLHQKNANRILGSRVAELEKKLKTLEVAGLWSLQGHRGYGSSEMGKNGVQEDTSSMLQPDRSDGSPDSLSSQSSTCDHDERPSSRAEEKICEEFSEELPSVDTKEDLQQMTDHQTSKEFQPELTSDQESEGLEEACKIEQAVSSAEGSPKRSLSSQASHASDDELALSPRGHKNVQENCEMQHFSDTSSIEGSPKKSLPSSHSSDAEGLENVLENGEKQRFSDASSIEGSPKKSLPSSETGLKNMLENHEFEHTSGASSLEGSPKRTVSSSVSHTLDADEFAPLNQEHENGAENSDNEVSLGSEDSTKRSIPAIFSPHLSDDEFTDFASHLDHTHSQFSSHSAPCSPREDSFSPVFEHSDVDIACASDSELSGLLGNAHGADDNHQLTF